MTCKLSQLTISRKVYRRPKLHITTIEDIIKAAYDSVTMVIIKRQRASLTRSNKWLYDLWAENDPNILKDKNRWRPIATGRQLAIYYLNTYTRMNSYQIAAIFNCERTIVNYSTNLVSGALGSKFDNDFKDCWALMLLKLPS